MVCASTGNTSASMAAYAARAGLPPGRAGAARTDRRRQDGAGRHARRRACCRCAATSTTACGWPASSPTPTRCRWSTRSTRCGSRGRRPPRSRWSTRSAGRPTCTCCRSATPATSRRTGRAIASTPRPGVTDRVPRMWGFQAAGAAPIVRDEPVADPETVATAIRVGNPASWTLAVGARDESGGRIDAVSDEQIMQAQRDLAARDGVFVEPASAAGAAGLVDAAQPGRGAGRRHHRGHRDRPRAQGRRHRAGRSVRWPTGSSTPTSTRPRAPPGCERRRDRVAATRPGDGRRPGDQRQPRTGLRQLRARARPANEVTAEVCERGLARRRRGEGAVRARARRVAPGGPGRRGRRSPRWVCSRPGCGCAAATGSRTGADWARRPRPSPPASSPPAPWCRTASTDSTTRPRCGWRPELEGHPDNVAAALLGGLHAGVDRRRRRARRTARAARRRRGPGAATRGADVDRERSAAGRGGPRRRRVTPRGGPACWSPRSPVGPSCCCRPPRTGCTSSTAARRCRRPCALVTTLRSAGHAAVVSGAGPTVLVLHAEDAHARPRRAGGRRVAGAAAAACRSAAPRPGAEPGALLRPTAAGNAYPRGVLSRVLRQRTARVLLSPCAATPDPDLRERAFAVASSPSSDGETDGSHPNPAA